MIVAISSSSPVSSVAFFTEEGDVLFSASREAPQAASGACLQLLEEGLQHLGMELKSARLFVADVGPGSFIGVRVGVTLAKTLAFTFGCDAAGVTSFDLVAPGAVVAVPSRKGEYFLRVPGAETVRVTDLPEGARGYGPAFDGSEALQYPLAVRAASLLGGLQRVAPETLMPQYLIEPSISQPKKPYASGAKS